MPMRKIKAFITCIVISTIYIYMCLFSGSNLSIIDKLNNRTLCKHIIQNPSYTISTKDVSWDTIENTVKNVKPGGRYTPNGCRSTWKVAIVVPYKGGEKNLKVFLRNIHPFLQEQSLDYGIFIIEMHSSTKFNRGLLMNIGFKESTRLYNYNCFIFHDVDLLPENRRNIYECSDHPKHMSSAISTRNYKMSYTYDFGGVNAFSKDQFTLVNGFSNVYVSSGREDSSLYYRAKYANLTIQRLPLDIGRYKDLTHKQPTLAQEKIKLYHLRQQRRLSNGLSNLTYRVVKQNRRPLYTRIVIDIYNRTSQKHNSKLKVTDVHEAEDGFYSYISTRGVSIRNISANQYRISYDDWNCSIDTSIAKKLTKNYTSWKDMFETDIDVLSKRTIFSRDALRHKLGVLPEDGTPITLVARQGNISIPKENVIIRLNSHGPLDARSTMVMTWQGHIYSLSRCAREQPNDEIIRWTHYKHGKYGNDRYYGLWNTSQPLVIPEEVWNVENLTYYRGPLFFMKGKYLFGNLAECKPVDGIGLGALNRVAQLNGEVSTLGFTTHIDSYNVYHKNRFYLFAHKLVWSYFAVEELTDTL